MTGKIAYHASVLSSNRVNFDFPYQGPQRARLVLRTHPRWGKSLFMQIEKGQILCRSYTPCTALVRFDDGQPVRFSGTGPDDNSTETVFISPYSRFAGLMLKAKTVRVSVPIYQEGSPVFEFNVEAFDIEKYRPSN